MLLCFAVHPQLPASLKGGSEGLGTIRESLATLEVLVEEGRLDAIGETGFDLYDRAFRETEVVQDELFAIHLETALRHGLPLVLHIRRAMHKVFAYTKALKRLPAVIFHSWPGTPVEGESLLKRGVNAYFSFGAAILLNHKEAIRSCAAFPVDRLLLETDAPYQSLRGREFSRWGDLPVILAGAAALRREAGTLGGTVEELERITDGNFYRIFQLMN
jgi:TatD DNase family protein